MTRRPQTVAFWRGRLPHWEVVDGRYFVTIHLAGAIPPEGHERIHRAVSALDQIVGDQADARLEVQRRVFREMEYWLDRAGRTEQLSDPRVAAMIVEAIRFRDGRDWTMFEFVVMPNHLHLFFELIGSTSTANSEAPRLKVVLEQFKRWTGHQAALLLALDGERFWQDEWFDHWSRSDAEDERIEEYIRRNPEKSGLVADYRDWLYGSWSAAKK